MPFRWYNLHFEPQFASFLRTIPAPPLPTLPAPVSFTVNKQPNLIEDLLSNREKPVKTALFATEESYCGDVLFAYKDITLKIMAFHYIA